VVREVAQIGRAARIEKSRELEGDDAVDASKSNWMRGSPMSMATGIGAGGRLVGTVKTLVPKL